MKQEIIWAALASACAAGLPGPALGAAPAVPPHGSQPPGSRFDSQQAWREVQAAHERKDWATVQRLYRQLAGAGDAIAMFNLGQMHRLGDGVTPNPGEAVRWYRKAAQAGHAGAQNNLGMAYMEGYGTARDPVQARYWLEKAAAQGHPKARENLARLAAGSESAQGSVPAEHGGARAETPSGRPSEAEDAARAAEAEAQRLSAEEKAVDDAMEALHERASKLMEAFGQGRQVSMSDVERTQRELAQMEQRRQRASEAADAARQRARDLRARADQQQADSQRLAQRPPVRQDRVAASPAGGSPANQPARNATPAAGGATPAGQGKLYYVVAGVYDKSEQICSDTRLVINGPMRSTSKPGVLAGEIRKKLRQQYPDSSYSSYLVEVASEGQAMILYQVRKPMAGYKCKDNHIQVALGRTMAEAESRMANRPRSWEFVREVQRWPQGLDR